MNTAAIWDALGDLPESEAPFVLSRLFAHYEERLARNPEDEPARHFFQSLELAISQTCRCNSNRR